jgi:protein gp37
MDLQWLRDLVDAADAAGTAVFVKQDSGRLAGKQGRIPDELWARKELS